MELRRERGLRGGGAVQKNPHLELLNGSPGGAAVGMVCSRVDVGKPEPVIGEDAVDLVGAELLLSLATNTPSRWRVGDFFGRGGEGKLSWRRVSGDANGHGKCGWKE